MSFSKDTFEKARKKANERLTGWITDAKQEQDCGITRLQKDFKHVFKKIEWKPAPLNLKQPSCQTSLNDQSVENTSPDRNNLFSNVILEGIHTNPTVGGIPPTIALDDHPIHDSNSSNLSSRLEYRDELRLPVIVTPQRTPFSTSGADHRDDSDVTLSPNPEWKANLRSRRTGVTQPINFRPRLKKRKKRVKHSLHSNAHSDLNEEDNKTDDFVQAETLGVPGLLVKKSSAQLSSIPSNKSFLFKSICRGGPLDLVLRRRAPRSNKHGVSKFELPVVTHEQTSEERRQELLRRFRRMVRLLIHVRVLLNVSRLRIEEEEKTKAFQRFDGGNEISFDPTAYKTAISVGGLTVRARKALRKNPKDRNEEDARILMDVMQRLSVFSKYPKAVKEDLARKMWYDNFHNGRVIVRQGDPGSRMYFIISGEVDLKRTDKTPAGEELTYHIRTITEGSTFGELALIRDLKREFTVICKGSSEFLSLSKDEFNHVLRSSWEKECNTRFNFLRSCDHFSDWTNKQLQFCADSSELKEYTDNKVILGDIEGQLENVYFIRKGRCEVVRRIRVVRHQSPYLRPNLLLPIHASRRDQFMNKTYCQDRRINRKETRFLTVTTLHPGSYFGAGENLKDTFILSRGKAQCVVINSAQFSIQGKSEQLRNLQSDRDKILPPNSKLYRKFQENRKWYEYRNQLLQEILSRKEVSSRVDLRHIPRSIVKEPTIPQDLIYYKPHARRI